MVTPNNDESEFGEFMSRYREVIRCLETLEGKNDEESKRLELELLDELMCMDMALGPYRKSMMQATNRHAPPNEGLEKT